MDMDIIYGLINVSIKAIGLITRLTVKEYISGPMGDSTMGSGLMKKCTGTAYTRGKMVESTGVNISIT